MLSLFAEKVAGLDTEAEDLTLVSSSTWHGAVLCLSAFLRSGLMSTQLTRNAVPWILRAFVFSQRRGTQKLGSAVRDGACYFSWCTARALSARPDIVPSSLIEEMAIQLAVVACTDEEVSVRRAAVAAFQELVGRATCVPDGLDVIVALDSRNSASKRRALLIAAPAVAEYSKYRAALIKRTKLVLVNHADTDMRELAATSLSLLIRLESLLTVESLIDEYIGMLLRSEDKPQIHGALSFLAEVCKDDTNQVHRCKVCVFLLHAFIGPAYPSPHRYSTPWLTFLKNFIQAR